MQTLNDGKNISKTTRFQILQQYRLTQASIINIFRNRLILQEVTNIKDNINFTVFMPLSSALGDFVMYSILLRKFTYYTFTY